MIARQLDEPNSLLRPFRQLGGQTDDDTFMGSSAEEAGSYSSEGGWASEPVAIPFGSLRIATAPGTTAATVAPPLPLVPRSSIFDAPAPPGNPLPLQALLQPVLQQQQQQQQQ
jgi:hypothetical protein